MVMRYQIGVPGVVRARHARGEVRDVVREVLDAIGDIPSRQDTRADQCARLHHDDDWPPASLQQRRVRDCTSSKLDDHTNGDLARRPDVPLVHRVAVGFQPQCKARLVDGEARLHEEVPQWKDPELPLLRDVEEFRAIPGVVAQRLLALGDEALALFVCLCFSDVEGSRGLWEVRDEEVSNECDRQ
jgi:hypothetical protein